jgi:Big-like domain-containing protein
MHDSQPSRRPLAGGLLLLVLAAAVTALLALPHSALAVGICDGDNPPSSCFEQHPQTQDVTLSVAKSAGTITSSPAGINCGSTCEVTAQQSRSCDAYDCTDWSYPSYTLTASGGPTGFAPSWGGACSGTSSTCNVTLDTDKSASLAWIDVTDPSVSLTVDSETGPTMAVSAAASDNAGVAKVEFWVDGVLKATDTTAPYQASIGMSSYADGSSHTVMARAYDTSSRIAQVSKSVTLDKSVNLTVDTPPAYTSAASLPIDFSTDSDALVQCQVNGGGWSGCSSPFSPPISSDGTYAIDFKAVDNVGNTVSITRNVTVDRTNPGLTFTDGPPEGGTVSTALATISFDVSDATPTTVECSIDGGAYGPCTTASSEDLSGLAPGSHSVSVRATDSAGNASTVTRHFSVTQPAAPGGGGGSGSGGGAGSGVLGAGPTPGVSKAKLSDSFKLKGKTTLVKKLVLSGLPNGAKVKVICHGHGCPFKSKSLSVKNGSASLTSLFKNKKLAKGVTIEIDVATPGSATQVFKLTTRAHKKPRLSTK